MLSAPVDVFYVFIYKSTNSLTESDINYLHAKFFRRNINMYLQLDLGND